MEQNYISAFDCFETGVRFNGAWYFSDKTGNKILLINSKGYILVIDKKLCESLSEHIISSDFAVKLYQRNMAKFLDSDDMEGASFDKLDNFPVRPEFFMIDLTNICNMKCVYCLRDYNEKTISDEMIDRICDFIIEYCRSNKMKTVSLQPWGGEPFLFYNKIVRILENFESAGIKPKMTIETNGTLLSKEKVEYLYNKNVNISVSIDGYESLHNLQRPLRNGNNSFEEVKKGISLLKNYYGDSLSVLVTITKKTAPFIKDIIEYLSKELNIHFMKLNFVHRSGFNENDELCLDENEISACSSEIMGTIVELQKEGIAVNEYNIWNKITNVVCRSRNDCCESRGCNGGKMLLAIDGEGYIYPCDLTDYPDERIGSIFDNIGLIEMISHATEKSSFFASKMSDKCHQCPWSFFCRGGCTVHVKSMGLQTGAVDSVNCASNQVLYPAVIDLILNDPAIIDKMIVGNR